MGCLNSGSGFTHWFGNVHLSGPCNRSCYFCIGQHMMALDGLNTLGVWPLPGIEDFVEKCRARGVREVFVTGTNTDPLLYRHTAKLTSYLREYDFEVGVRTNAVANLNRLGAYDKGSVTVCSTNPKVYRSMMGRGAPPNLERVLRAAWRWSSLKVNVVLGPENVGADLDLTLKKLADAGVRRVSLREPYGQPHVGDPLAGRYAALGKRLGAPTYLVDGVEVSYWDVHFCEVESVNLYASGRVSEDYPITRGHAPDGAVQDQSKFPGGRVRDQWVRLPVVK